MCGMDVCPREYTQQVRSMKNYVRRYLDRSSQSRSVNHLTPSIHIISGTHYHQASSQHVFHSPHVCEKGYLLQPYLMFSQVHPNPWCIQLVSICRVCFLSTGTPIFIHNDAPCPFTCILEPVCGGVPYMSVGEFESVCL
jgi:hypothetical protein